MEQLDAAIISAAEDMKRDFFFVPKTSHTRFRVEICGEQSEPWKDSGMVFDSVTRAEQYIKDFVPHNQHSRILFETMQVVKFTEYKPPYTM